MLDQLDDTLYNVFKFRCSTYNVGTRILFRGLFASELGNCVGAMVFVYSIRNI